MIDRLSRQIAFLAPAAVMSSWATVMLHTIATGHINRLLSPLFRNYVLAAAIALFLLSALYILLYQPPAQNPASAFTRTGKLRQIGRWLVLLIPLVAASILSPAALSNSTLQNRQLDPTTAGAIPMPTWNSTNPEATKAILDSDPNQAAPVEVTDLITLSHSPSQVGAFDGRKVRVVGLFNSQKGDPRLVRWIMWCCAADAQPASVLLTGNTKGDWKDEQWLEVTGTAKFPSTLGHVVPEIEVDSIKPTSEPDEPYLSP